ncbi:hypothetical protein [Paraburkholderia hiiakae]|uniref:hypothetical protein n=1 Tax=Paraburkholderia hiiakae TaxID=1081782 RepID=UPI001918C6CF|nr:hypothetical protein [Paraburkholderia hiiakae]
MAEIVDLIFTGLSIGTLFVVPRTIIGTGIIRSRPERLKRFQDFLDVFATNGVGVC